MRAYLDIDDLLAHRRAGALRRHSSRATDSCRRIPRSRAPARRPALISVGPPPEMLETLGDKIGRAQSGRAGRRAGPAGDGSAAARRSRRRKLAEKLGYPVMVKAARGGGGRGMRVVPRAEQLDELAGDGAQRSADRRSAATTSFSKNRSRARGTSKCRLLGDQHGNLVHLFERDCSVQRRHQKVVEIAPALNLDPQLRKKLCDAALRDRPGRAATRTPAPSSSWSMPTPASSTSSRSIRAFRSSTPSPRTVTGVDIVKCQILVAQGSRRRIRKSAWRRQDEIQHARLCPAVPRDDRRSREPLRARLRPDHRRIARPAAWAFGSTPARRFPARWSRRIYDSLLVKVTAWGRALRRRGAPHGARAAGVPRPRREDEHSVPASIWSRIRRSSAGSARRRSSTKRRSCSDFRSARDRRTQAAALSWPT